MTLHQMSKKLGLTVCCGEKQMRREVTGGYSGDLLSDVMTYSNSGEVWVTMQVHVNIVAVAVLKDLSAIILVNGRIPAEDTLKKAIQGKIVILSSPQTAFVTVGRLFELGIKCEL